MVDIVTRGAHVSAILLAAGLSTRMGPVLSLSKGQNKALLPWLGATLLEYQLGQLSRSKVDDIVLVLGHQAELLRPLAAPYPKALVVFNHHFQQGRATSVVAGVRSLSEHTSAVLILGVDQPRPWEIIDTVVEAHLTGRGLITIPAYRGRRGHPVAFAGSLIPELKEISDERQGLKEVVRRDPGRVLEVPLDSPLLLLDLNTPQDHERGLAVFRNLKSQSA